MIDQLSECNPTGFDAEDEDHGTTLPDVHTPCMDDPREWDEIAEENRWDDLRRLRERVAETHDVCMGCPILQQCEQRQQRILEEILEGPDPDKRMTEEDQFFDVYQRTLPTGMVAGKFYTNTLGIMKKLRDHKDGDMTVDIEEVPGVGVGARQDSTLYIIDIDSSVVYASGEPETAGGEDTAESG